MALVINNATQISNIKSTYTIYAAPGTGKTTAIKYLPGKTLLLDIDKSSAVLKGLKHIDIADIDTHNIWDSWLDAVKDLLNNRTAYEQKYDNIVIDNVSELFRACLANLGREGNNNRVPSQGDYQRVDFTILDSLRALKLLNVRLVFTAWETSDSWTDTNNLVFNRYLPDIRPKILNNFMGLCDVVARLTIKTTNDGQDVRGYVLQPRPDVYAKNRLDQRLGCKVEELILKENEHD